MRQRTRVAMLLLSFSGFLFVNRVLTGQWFRLPPGDKGIWFQSGLLLVVLGSLLVEPHYAKPADAAANATAALVTLFALNSPEEFIAWPWLVAYCIITLALALTSMALWDPTTLEQGRAYHAGRLCYQVSTRLGRAKWLFLLLFVLAVLSYFEAQSSEFILLMVFGAAVLSIPTVRLPAFVQSMLGVLGVKKEAVVGTLDAAEAPRLALTTLARSDSVQLLDAVKVQGTLESGIAGQALVLDFQYLPETTRARLLMLTPFRSSDLPGEESSADKDRQAKALVFKIPEGHNSANGELAADPIWQRRERLVGIVSENSRVAEIQVELRSGVGVEQGSLVCASVGGNDVVYQVIEGATRSDGLASESRHGYITATARQMGVWNEDNTRFDSCPWVPELHSPVYRVVAPDDVAEQPTSIDWPYCQLGVVPGSTYPVLVNLNDLVTHHAAILGITGCGKTWLTLELITRLVQGAVKTLCLDPLGEYAGRLSDADPVSVQNPQELDHFLNSPDKLLALGAYSGGTGFPQATSRYVSRALNWAAQQSQADDGGGAPARLCIVLDEAHALIPEWTSVVDDQDKRFVNMTCHTILQGRRYGVGALVITQRTANVTKTVLNQCNTILALQCFDQTGYDFLKNYMGDEYVEALATLPPQHAVVVGRASRAAVPLIVRLPSRAAPVTPSASECCLSLDQDDF
jgi:hypothetical protein